MPTFIRFLLRSFGAIFLSFLALSSGPEYSLAEGDKRFGLWVEAEGVNQPFLNKENFNQYLSFIEQWPFTDVYCQVYRGGRSWFPSMVADDEPFRLAKQQGFDPLGDTIRAARKRGQKVHAWVNMLRLFQNPDAPMIKVIGAERTVQFDNFGNSVLKYDEKGNPPGANMGFSLGTHGIWVDPSEPAVRHYIKETIRDLVYRYPDLSGVHMDMVRFPTAIRTNFKKRLSMGPEYGFSDNSIRHFYRTSGRAAPDVIDEKLRKQLSRSQAWAAWRRAQVTLLVFEVRELLSQIAPNMEVSAAVFADQKRARDGAFQDWPTWMKYHLLDTVVPMNYTKRRKLFTRLSKEASEIALRPQLLMGIGAWLLKSKPEEFVRQGEIAISSKSGGVVLFSYSNLFSPQGRNALNYFQQKLFPTAHHVLKDNAG